MSAEPQLFKIKIVSQNKDSKAIVSGGSVEETEFASLGLLEKHIEDWIADNPGILEDRLRIIARQYGGFDKTGEKPDLIAVDREGNLVVIELKRDDSGSDTHWQAIKYASYLRNATLADIISIFAKYKGMPQSDAKEELLDHIDPDSLDELNNGQRIILASHRFAPQVTSAALWMNENAQMDNLITCIRLVPYRDEVDGSLHIQAYSVIPSPAVEVIKPGIKQVVSKDGNKDEVTKFCRKVAGLVKEGISEQIIIPDGWNSKAGGTNDRWYRLWYSRSPWQNKRMRYRIRLYPEAASKWRVDVGIEYYSLLLKKRLSYSDEDCDALHNTIQALDIPGAVGNMIHNNWGWWGWRTVELDGVYPLEDDEFAEHAANTFKQVIEIITPAVNEFEKERIAKKSAP